MIGLGLFAVLALLFGVACMWGNSPRLRACSYAVLMVSLALFYWLATGLPRHEYAHLPQGTLLAFSLDEPKAIFLWIMPKGSTQPLYVRAVWSPKMAQEILQAVGDRQGNQEIRIGRQTSASGERIGSASPRFYLTPIRPTPPKSSPTAHGK